MKALLKTLALLLLLNSGGGNLLLADNARPGLLEQSKMVLGDVATEAPAQWIEERTGEFLPLDLVFVDEQGRSVSLATIIDRPTIFLPIYFYCPNICSKNLANLAIALNNLSFQAGRDYRVIALSFNEAEGSEDAARAKRNYAKILDPGFPEHEWHFLTGTGEAIKTATDAVGFRFKKIDDETFIHPAALMTIAADGKIIRYIYGSFLAGDIDMGLADAASGTPSLSVKRFLDFCFNYDPRRDQSLFQSVKVGVLLVFAVGLAFVFLYFKRKRPENRQRP